MPRRKNTVGLPPVHSRPFSVGSQSAGGAGSLTEGDHHGPNNSPARPWGPRGGAAAGAARLEQKGRTVPLGNNPAPPATAVFASGSVFAPWAGWALRVQREGQRLALRSEYGGVAGCAG